MRDLQTLIFGISGFLCLAFSGVVRSDQMMPVSIEQLGEQSQLILHGTVLSKSCQRDDAGRIYTQVALQVAEVWKGAIAANPFTLVHGGGMLGDKRVLVSNQVDFQIGEEVVAFLVLNQRGEGVCLGLAQGKFHVWVEPGTKRKLARNPFHGGPASAASGAQMDQPAPDQRLTLSELQRRVQGAKQ